MFEQFIRTELLLGGDAMERLYKSHVVVFGAGGVGSYAIEAMARCGIGRFTVIDGDTVCASNINRQLIALNSTLGKPKVSVVCDRILDINPNACVNAVNIYYTEQNTDEIDFNEFDYVVDAIDMVSSKVLIIKNAKKLNIPIISAMGAGGKLDPTAFRVSNIFETTVCPLCKVMRKELKKEGILELKVVYSNEPPIKPIPEEGQRRGTIPSISFVPSVAGLIIGGEVVKDIAGIISR